MSELMNFESIAKERVMESMTYLDPSDRKEWRVDALLALETNNVSLDATKNRGALLNSLYKTVVADAKTVNFGKVDASKGNIMNLPGWKTTEKSIDTLSKLVPDAKEVKVLTDLHDALVQCRPDFEYGYKYDIELVKTIYCVMVFNMYELIDTCICVYSAKVNGGHPPKHKYAVTTAQQYIQLVKSGEWNRIMKAYKSGKSAPAKECVEVYAEQMHLDDEDMSATEAANLLTDIFEVISFPVSCVFGLVTLLFGIRALIAFFYRKSAELSSYLHNQADLLDNITEADRTMTDEQKQQVMKTRNKIVSVAAYIDTKILKAEKEADKDQAAYAKQDAAAMKAAKSAPMTPAGRDPYITADGDDDGLIL